MKARNIIRIRFMPFVYQSPASASIDHPAAGGDHG